MYDKILMLAKKAVLDITYILVVHVPTIQSSGLYNLYLLQSSMAISKTEHAVTAEPTQI